MKHQSMVLLFVCVLTSCTQQTNMPGQPTRTTLDPTVAPGRMASDNWIDKIAEYVVMKQAVSREGNFDVLLADLRAAKEARERGDWAGQYEALNRFIDKLDARVGGISEKTARDIREYTYLVEPWGYHDLARDRKIHPEVKKWAERRERQREEITIPQAS